MSSILYWFTPVFSLWDGIDVFLTSITMVALYGYLFRKEILSQFPWRHFFFVVLVWSVYYIFFAPIVNLDSVDLSQFGVTHEELENQSWILIDVLYYFIEFISLTVLYLYAFRKRLN